MTTETVDIEKRLTKTLRTVADQTEPVSPGGGRYEVSDELSTGDAGRSLGSRGVWLAVAAAVAVGFGALGYSTYGTTTTEAAGPAPEFVLDGGPLYLLPSADFELPATIEGQVGADVVDENDLSSMVVGRRDEDGYENLLAILHSTDNGRFAVDTETSQTIAGREVFDSFDEGVAEPLDDGTWIIYQTEFGDPGLERAVAATSVVDGLLAFDDPEQLLERVALIEDATVAEKAVVSLFPTSDSAPPPGGPIEGFVLLTATAGDDAEALLYAAGFGASYVEEVTSGDPANVIYYSRPMLGVSLMAWSPTPGTVAAMWVMGGDQDLAIEFVENMRIVDAETWKTELGG